jgi:hydrogenase maturation protease
MSRAKLLIIGVGQQLRGDDGVGIEVVERWLTAYPEFAKLPDLWVETAPLPGLSLLSFLECVDAAILVDAVESGAAPGTIHVLDRDDLSSFGTSAQSAHGWGVAETLVLADAVYGEKLPETILVLGIEAQSMELGTPVSAAVQAGIPAAVKRLQELVLQCLATASQLETAESREVLA